MSAQIFHSRSAQTEYETVKDTIQKYFRKQSKKLFIFFIELFNCETYCLNHHNKVIQVVNTVQKY